MAEEDVFGAVDASKTRFIEVLTYYYYFLEQMTKQNETLKIKIMCNEQYETSLKADQQQKMRELDRIQAVSTSS